MHKKITIYEFSNFASRFIHSINIRWNRMISWKILSRKFVGNIVKKPFSTLATLWLSFSALPTVFIMILFISLARNHILQSIVYKYFKMVWLINMRRARITMTAHIYINMKSIWNAVARENEILNIHCCFVHIVCDGKSYIYILCTRILKRVHNMLIRKNDCFRLL